METEREFWDAREEINRIFVGKKAVVDDILTCLIAGGHILLEDVPGVGKTTLAKVIASVTGCSMGRIQFTPDTLPGDITGISVYNMKTGEFEYRQGVVMNQILLTDEINRTPPKTQASLLEAMSEGQVTVDGICRQLPEPFLVIATQNPAEYLGTFPLSEALLDRFMMRLSIGYPDKEREIVMMAMNLKKQTPDTARQVLKSSDISILREKAAEIQVRENVLEYMENIVRMTRNEGRFMMGASPRALLSLMRASQSRAFLEGRNYVKPDDVKAVASKVLLHRLTLTADARMSGMEAGAVFDGLLLRTKIPAL